MEQVRSERSFQPAVSIVMPVYNRDALIARALDSVLAQTFTDYETIIVDDGSTDRTWEVVDRFASREARVRPFRQPNGGPGAARNVGIENACGGWIAFLDSDDIWTPAKLANAMRLARENRDVEFIHTNWQAVYPDGTYGRIRDASPFDRLSDKKFLLSSFRLKTSTVVIKRDLINRIGGHFYTERPLYEDYHLFWRAVIAARAIGYIETCDTVALQSTESLVRSSTALDNLEGKIFAMDRLRLWILNSGLGQEYLPQIEEMKYRQFQDRFRTLLTSGQARDLVRPFLLCCRSTGIVRGVRGLISVAVEPLGLA
jgi:glycosyltransferase involved in cell wall biosynthesis